MAFVRPLARMARAARLPSFYSRGFSEEGAEKRAPEAPVNPMTDKIKALESDRDKYKDFYLRAVAEQDNIRKRYSNEVENERVYSVSKFAKEMVEVNDNLRRALENVPKCEEHKGLNDLVEGVTMTRRQMETAFKKFDVEEYSALKEKFDPNKHEALFTYPDPSLPNGVVGQVIATGYRIKDRVLRIAKVGVVKNE
jgi:molecular chaperone GrpE